MVKKRFLRRNTTQYLRLGRKRKKLQKWRNPSGRDNKMRLKTKGYPRVVSVGYRTDLSERGKINGKEIKRVQNLNDIANHNKDVIYSLGRVGNKKKIEIAKIAKEKKLEFVNFNYNKFLLLNEKNTKRPEVKK
ncbi:MAG: eL32 family ribosomal protein [Nanoarchaeota archaeon]